MSGLVEIFCILWLVNGLSSLSEKTGRKAVLSKFLKDNQKELRDAKDDEVINNALKSQFIGSSQLSSDLSYAYLVVLSDSVGTAACASGWTRYSGTGMCYKLSEYDMSWYKSEEYCWNQRAGAHLASIHSEAESRWLNAQFRDKYGQMDAWIGLRRDCDNVTYVWTDKSPTDFLWWQPEYPRSEFAEFSCVTLWEQSFLLDVDGYVPGQYDDMKECSSSGGSVALCKYDPNTSIIGEKYVKKTCSLIPETTSTTTSTTSTTTTTTTTTTPTTTTTTPTTSTTAPTTTTVTTTTPTTTTTTPTTTTTTTTTTPTTTTPTTTTTIPTTTTKATTTTAAPSGPVDCSPKCDPFWISYKGGCYGLVQGTSDFSTAELGCQAFGGEMAVITDADMNEAMRLAFSTNNDSTVAHQAWIGASSYSNWAPGKPNKAQGTQYPEYCNVFALSVVNNGLDFGFSRGVWTDYPCALTQEFVLCKQN
ncbi:hypothetical protein CRE_28711 [Caenorhabditis remanei]|uniref:C-type lectin domain-containing protein n=1 Tax=Caenorhabditis remanei TaxID=31234 RepID=E3MK51_CAERE|nr:hypothetical protein CRE_28711 [Caenorhabditis remanei]